MPLATGRFTLASFVLLWCALGPAVAYADSTGNVDSIATAGADADADNSAKLALIRACTARQGVDLPPPATDGTTVNVSLTAAQGKVLKDCLQAIGMNPKKTAIAPVPDEVAIAATPQEQTQIKANGTCLARYQLTSPLAKAGNSGNDNKLTDLQRAILTYCVENNASAFAPTEK